MVGQLVERAVATGMLEREVPRLDGGDQAAGRGQDPVEALGEGSRGQPLGALVAGADQVGEGGRIPAVHDPPAGDDGGDRRHAEALQLGARARLRLDVDRVERHRPRREQLSRLGAGASAGTVVENRCRVSHLKLLPSTAS